MLNFGLCLYTLSRIRKIILINLLKTIIAAREYSVLVTLFSIEHRKAYQPGTCLCLNNSNVMANGLDALSYKNQLLYDAKKVLENQCSSIFNYNFSLGGPNLKSTLVRNIIRQFRMLDKKESRL